ncbi:hypothetical protein QBC32DRAFT_372474 [Pseudoneurospora amorphoporcata]|uniref:Uncharacterized protein n=1 Tax=Pseudoneurospora amorphoporcata TaxID=241081 RepID=A0AAN6SD19_9PEZI|nr:hypothetical protein QBC32DRAFT_372474 [Pseudoneurospora amorphoporcata]
MARRTLVDFPEELLQAILAECRTWIHPSLKNTDAEPIDFDTYSDFHLRLDYVEYLPAHTSTSAPDSTRMQSTEHRPEIPCISPKQKARFKTLILNDYSRSYQTLESLWLNSNSINKNESYMNSLVIDRLHISLKPHQSSLKSLRIGLAVTPFAYAATYRPLPGVLDVPTGSGFGLHHGVIPNFREYRSLEHLHLSSIFAGHEGFAGRRNCCKSPDLLEGLHKEVDGLLPPRLTRITLDVGCECALRHCPCFPLDDLEGRPVCHLLCPLDGDVWAFLITLARRAKDTKARLRQIHVNYCVRPFALPMPLEDLPEEYNWDWTPPDRNVDFSPWEYLNHLKKKVEKHGFVFTYSGLEPICGVPRTHLQRPKISESETSEIRARILRWHDLRLFDYEDEMCSEHIWTVVRSG